MASFEQHMNEQLRVDHASADRYLYRGEQLAVSDSRGEQRRAMVLRYRSRQGRVTNRRIGRNELNTISVCQVLCAPKRNMRCTTARAKR